jgi:hypothetical protein
MAKTLQSQFQVGDKIRALKTSGTSPLSYRKGEIYQVIEAKGDSWDRKNDLDRIETSNSLGLKNGWLAKNFELVKRIDHKFKAGDKVRLIDDRYGTNGARVCLKKGGVYTIISSKDHTKHGVILSLKETNNRWKQSRFEQAYAFQPGDKVRCMIGHTALLSGERNDSDIAPREDRVARLSSRARRLLNTGDLYEVAAIGVLDGVHVVARMKGHTRPYNALRFELATNKITIQGDKHFGVPDGMTIDSYEGNEEALLGLTVTVCRKGNSSFARFPGGVVTNISRTSSPERFAPNIGVTVMWGTGDGARKIVTDIKNIELDLPKRDPIPDHLDFFMSAAPTKGLQSQEELNPWVTKNRPGMYDEENHIQKPLPLSHPNSIYTLQTGYKCYKCKDTGNMGSMFVVKCNECTS